MQPIYKIVQEVPHNPWLEAARDFGVIAAADLAAMGAHETLTKKYAQLPTFQPMAKEANLAVTKTLRGLSARDAAYTRGISRMPSGKGSSIITKSAGVAEDQARTNQFIHDKDHAKLRWLTPEASTAIQSAATAGAAYAATKGLAHVIPSAGAAAPWLAGAAGLYSATDYGKKVNAHESRVNKTMAAIIRDQARQTDERTKQANIMEELAEEGFNHAVNHKLFHRNHHENKYLQKVAEWNRDGAFMGGAAGLVAGDLLHDNLHEGTQLFSKKNGAYMLGGALAGTVLGGLYPHEKKAFVGQTLRSISQLGKGAAGVAKTTWGNATKSQKRIAGGVAATVGTGAVMGIGGNNSNQIKQASIIDSALHTGHGLLNFTGDALGHLSGGHIQKYVAKNAGKSTQVELDLLHKMDDDALLKEFHPESKHHAELVDLIQKRKAARALAGGAAGYGIYNKMFGAQNGQVH